MRYSAVTVEFERIKLSRCNPFTVRKDLYFFQKNVYNKIENIKKKLMNCRGSNNIKLRD